MTPSDAIERLVLRPVQALRVEDAHGLTVDLYPPSRYELLGDWLIVGDDTADKIGAALDGRGLHFLRSDGEMFVNSTIELLRRFVQIYADTCSRYADRPGEDGTDTDPNELCRRFEALDPPAMASTATSIIRELSEAHPR